MSGAGDELLEKFLDCSSRGDVETLRAMMPGSRALLNARDERGWTALMMAARNGHYEVAEALLSHGCDTSLTNRSGHTARDVALFWGQGRIARLLSSDRDARDPPVALEKATEENFFSRQTLDRTSERRTDPEWVEQRLAAPDTVLVLFHQLNPLVRDGVDGRPSLCQLPVASARELLKREDAVLVFLGVATGDSAWFALGTEEGEPAEHQTRGSYFLQPPVLGLLTLSDTDAGVVAQARSVLAWHSRYRFCPTCGGRTAVEEAGWKRTCVRAGCRSLQGVHNTCYPRVDPAVIMLVIHPDGNQCLLGRKKRFPPGMFSCLAGFVEPGETVEAAARREVREESGVRVGPVRYVSCQAWPAPSCLMIGCQCVALTTAVTPDGCEIEEARWFTREQVLLAHVGDERAVFSMPPRQTIAHAMLKHWIGTSANL